VKNNRQTANGLKKHKKNSQATPQEVDKALQEHHRVHQVAACEPCDAVVGAGGAGGDVVVPS